MNLCPKNRIYRFAVLIVVGILGAIVGDYVDLFPSDGFFGGMVTVGVWIMLAYIIMNAIRRRREKSDGPE